MSFRDVTIKIPDRGCDQGCQWRHTPEAWAEIWEKSVSWVLPSEAVSWVPALEEEGWLSLAHRGLTAGVMCSGGGGGGGRWKSQYRKIVSLSLCQKTF